MASVPSASQLELSPLEKYLFWDDQSDAPMTPLAELRFSSTLDVTALENAINETLTPHLLLRSRVVPYGESLFWNPADHRIKIEQSIAPTTSGQLRSLDLREQPGLRVWLEQTAGGSHVVFQWHHACCDGIAFRNWLLEVLKHYAGSTKSTPPASYEVAHVDKPHDSRGNRLKSANWDLELLKCRADYSDITADQKASISSWQRIANAYYFHFRTPQPLRSTASIKSSNTTATSAPGLPYHVLSREVSTAIVDKCRQEHIAVNNLAIALLFVQCARWNTTRGVRSPSARIRILVPFDLRRPKHRRLPAANRLSFAFIGRTHRQCSIFDRLIQSVASEMEMSKKTNLPLDFLAGLRAASRSPRIMKWLIRASSKMSTVVLTYSGEFARGTQRSFPVIDGQIQVGQARLARALAAPPARRNTHIALGLCFNWGQLCLTANWNRLQFPASDCQLFVDEYARQWVDWLEGKSHNLH